MPHAGGRRPTPTPILKLHGSDRVRRRELRGEPQVPVERPAAPDWLVGPALAMWDDLIPQLESLGVLARIDRNALGRYCRLWVRWRVAEDFLDQYGSIHMIKDDKGAVRYLQQVPQVAIAGKLASELRSLEQEFGMTPSARTRVSVRKSVADELSKFVAERSGQEA